MAHPFEDKLVVFIGTPLRCSRAEARDALIRVGGIPDDSIVTFTNYAVAFNGAENTKKYEKAAEHHKHGFLVLLNEEQFFDVLEGRSVPPPPIKKTNRNRIITPAIDQAGEDRRHEETRQDILHRRRLKNLAQHGVPTEDGRVKADLRGLDKIRRVMDKQDEQK